MSNSCLSCTDERQWQSLLADPVKHWRTGYSARTLAHSWLEADGFPPEVARVLRSAPEFCDIEMVVGVPEYQVALPGGSRPSQNDLWVLARAQNQWVSIAVEGKVREPFDELVREWRAEASDGKRERITYLASVLGLPTAALDDVRYQLVHRTASALIEATRFGATRAVMIVHSFSQTYDHFEDFRAFTSLFRRDAVPEKLIALGTPTDTALYCAWITGKAKYLEM